MAVGIVRDDLNAVGFRSAAAASRDGAAVRRMLALALIVEGVDRTTAARTCGMDRQTWFRRQPAAGLIFHSDRGNQYASKDFAKLLANFTMKASMSRKGDCWDNAVTETLFGSLKVEQLHGMRFGTRRQAKDEVIDWITFYNHRRLHSTLGYTSPMAFEQKWLAGQISLAA